MRKVTPGSALMLRTQSASSPRAEPTRILPSISSYCSGVNLARSVASSGFSYFTAERSADYTQLHLRLYLNGSQVAAEDLDGWYPNQAFGQDDYTRYLVMGRNYMTSDGSPVGDDHDLFRHFRGQLDDVRVYDGALTAAQVVSLYENY